MANRSTVILDTRPMQIKLGKIPKQLQGDVSLACEYIATEGETYMKSHAPWMDRTSAARNGLRTHVLSSAERWEIIFAHSVSYGIWLEVKQSGKYEIILPTIRHEVTRLRQLLRGIMDR